jgi:hypothetical protein
LATDDLVLVIDVDVVLVLRLLVVSFIAEIKIWVDGNKRRLLLWDDDAEVS